MPTLREFLDNKRIETQSIQSRGVIYGGARPDVIIPDQIYVEPTPYHYPFGFPAADSSPTNSNTDIEKRIADAKKNGEEQSAPPDAETKRLAEEAARQEAELAALQAAVNKAVAQKGNAAQQNAGSDNPLQGATARQTDANRGKGIALLLILIAAAVLFYPMLQKNLKA